MVIVKWFTQRYIMQTSESQSWILRLLYFCHLFNYQCFFHFGLTILWNTVVQWDITLTSLPFFLLSWSPGDLAALTGGCTLVCCLSPCVCPRRSDRKLARLRSAWASVESFRLGVRKTWWHHCNGKVFWRRREGGVSLWGYFWLLINAPSQVWDPEVQLRISQKNAFKLFDTCKVTCKYACV